MLFTVIISTSWFYLFSWTWDFLQQQLKLVGLGLFTLSLCLPLKVELSFYYYSIFIFKYIFSTWLIRNASNGENQTENHTNPIWFQKSVQNNQPMKKTRVFSWIAFCIERQVTSSLRISRLCPETSTKLYFHEFHLRTWLSLHTVPSPPYPLIVCVVNAGGVFSPW